MTLDLSKYMIQDQPQNQEPMQQSQSAPEPLELDKYLSPEESSTFDNFKRHTARIGSRVGETIAGFPGDFVNFVNFMAEKLPNVPTGKPNALQELGRKGLEKLPTSDDIKQFSEQYTKGYTKAQGKAEELGDDIVSLTTALMIPARNPASFSKLLGSIGKNLAKATAVKGAGEGAEMLGGGPKTKAATEVGMLFLTGLLGKKTANQYISEKYQKATAAIPQGDIVPTNKLLIGLEKVKQELAKGVKTPTKKEVLTPLKELKKKADGGGMLAEDLVQSYHDINERLNAKKLFDELNKGERQILRKRYDMLRDEVRDTIQDYGKRNPAFLKEWQEANQGYATIAQSKKVSDFIGKHKNKISSHLATTVAAELFFGHPQVAAATLGGAATATGLVKTGELLYRISKSPTLRKHYLNVIKEATNENLPGVIKNLEELDRGLKADNKYRPLSP